MALSVAMKRKYSHMAMSLCFALTVFYFGYHTVSGERGLLKMLTLSKQVETAEQRLDEVKLEKMQYQHRVEMMRAESIDVDLLDEQSRKLLGYANSNEVIHITEE